MSTDINLQAKRVVIMINRNNLRILVKAKMSY